MKVLVFGTFDHLHPGHQYVLNTAQERGELCVVVARDATVERLKGFKPTQNEKDRLAAISQLYPQAQVLLGSDSDYLAPIRALKPDLILLGYDQALPPPLALADLGCPVQRLDAFEPDKWKSSLLRPEAQNRN